MDQPCLAGEDLDRKTGTALPEAGGGRFVGHRDRPWLEAADLFLQPLIVIAGRQSYHAKLVGKPLDDVQRARSDGSSRSKDDN